MRHGAHGRPKKQGGRPRRRDTLLQALQPHVNVLSRPAGARALDVGCGDGKFLNGLQDLGWDTYGIEPSSSVAFLRHHRLESPPQDGSFDLVVLHHVLEHVIEPLALLRAVSATLRDGGGLFVSVPRLDTLAQHGDFRYCINGRNHPLAFSETCLRGLLARAGFEHGRVSGRSGARSRLFRRAAVAASGGRHAHRGAAAAARGTASRGDRCLDAVCAEPAGLARSVAAPAARQAAWGAVGPES